MSGQRQPHRKMAADGARTENAYPHGVDVLIQGWLRAPVSTSLRRMRNRPCDLHRWHGEKRWIKFRVPRHSA